MLQASTRTPSAPFGRTAVLTLIAAAVLSACGGGGGDPGTVPAASGGSGTGTSPTVPTTPTTPVATETTVSLVMTDGAGANVTSLSGGQSGTLKATVLTPAGKPAVGAIVQFATGTAGMLVFTPETGSALTDANGVAVVTVKPASYTTAGAVAVSATSVVEGKTGTGGVNLAIGAAPLTVGTLSFATAPTGRLPAFSTLALNIPVTSAGQPATASTGLTLSSLCVGDGTATLVPGAISNGVQVATYTNNGCVRGRDTITAAIGNSSQTIGVDVSAANIGAIQFSNTSQAGTSIVLKGSGGQGRSESAQVTFRVVDQQGNGLAGVDVDFSATTYTGGLTVSPLRATTDASGNASTMVSSGTIPTPVRVLATATRNGTSMTGLSDTLTVSTGLPIQRSMSLSAEHHNIEGGNVDGTKVGVTVRLADQYGNPVSNGTAVNFVTEGGAIGSAAQGGCVTVDGGCSVDLVSQNYRPADGRVTVLAFVQGIENFTDSNGDGQYSCTGFTGPAGTYRPLVDACPSGGEPFEDMGDPFLDTNLNRIYESNDRDLPFPFNSTSYKAGGNGTWGLNYLRAATEIVFSGSTGRLSEVCVGATCTGATYNNGAVIAMPVPAGLACAAPRSLSVRLADANNNPLPYNTALSVVSPTKVTVSAPSPAIIPSTTVVGGTVHMVTVTPDPACVPGDFTLQAKTPQGKITEFKFTVN
ncbi:MULTISPECIES: Ig-like domain-containing protein [unclassified Massilia]|uniref:Ig-like domain-containing protein n=1 Tax=unclassified Massilia TaxID=2609279 RepID=UPI00177AAEE6|nr:MULTISPECIES: Ig-like domain-containing protein [unclassified Massilia]MBD8533317.1 Ig-like domain-containing protein [Massilia sp. CFBP 13647]MBD8676725.1 Ig-like domain-containing protein [Massilia sp. CFBP 13721]